MENVLYIAQESVEVIEDSLDSEAFPDIVPKQFYVCMPVIDKGNIVSWLTSDPDDEEDLTFSKDFRLAFEFKDIEHAKRAKDLIAIEMNVDAIIFGEMS